jgi:GTP-binding protein Era
MNETQLIFIDTPGLVSKHESIKFKLEKSFINDTQNSIKNADVIGIVQDVSKAQSTEIINNKIINLFDLSKLETNIILILNKIDTIKNKKMLLEITSKLLKSNQIHFSDVFMISALKGDGVKDLRVCI